MANKFSTNTLLLSGQVVTATPTSLFVNGNSIAGGGTTILNAVTGFGTNNYIPKFINNSGLINSNIIDSGNQIVLLKDTVATGNIYVSGGVFLPNGGPITLGNVGIGTTTLNNAYVTTQYVNLYGNTVLNSNNANKLDITNPSLDYVIDVRARDFVSTGNIYVSGGVASSNYRNFWVDAGAMSTTVISGATAATQNYSGVDNFSSDVYLFDDTTPEYVNFKMMMPEEWNKGAIKAKFNWTPTNPTGNVVWEISAGSIADSGDIGAVLGAKQEVLDLAYNTGKLHMSSGSPFITVGNSPNTGMMTYFRIGRVANHVLDTTSGDVRLLGIGIQYQEQPITVSSW